MPNLAVSEITTFGDNLKVVTSPQAKLEKPELLVVSGIHGDETEAIALLFLLLNELKDELPPWIFAPVMSYSANQLQTQNMATGDNMNRSFTKEPAPPEVQQAKDFVREKGPFQRILSVHEDEDLTHHTYVYIEGQKIRRYTLQDWRDAVHASGGKLRHGYDDPNDPALGMFAFQGHIKNNPAKTPQMFESWAVNEGHTPQAVTMEIPGKAPMEEKYKFLRAGLRLVMIGKKAA